MQGKKEFEQRIYYNINLNSLVPENHFLNITDLINDYIKRGEKVGVYPVSEKSWMDMGQFEALQETLKKFEV